MILLKNSIFIVCIIIIIITVMINSATSQTDNNNKVNVYDETARTIMLVARYENEELDYNMDRANFNA
jgi:ABC-type transport system involved in multi-copper enzyme maturation permease subunit